MSRVVDEKFEGAGYEEAWGEIVTAGGSEMDEDQATSGVSGSPADWDDDCLKNYHVAAAAGIVVTSRRLNIGNITKSYLRIEIIVSDWSDMINNDTHGLVQVLDGGFGNCYLFQIKMIGGSHYPEIMCFHDGNVNIYTAFTPMSLNTRHRLEGRWDADNDEWEWRLDGTNQPNNIDGTSPVTSPGTLTGGHKLNVDHIILGQNNHSSLRAPDEMLIYFDNIALDNADWVGTDAIIDGIGGSIGSKLVAGAFI